MKQGHFAVLFIIVYLSCFFTLYLEQRNYDMVLEEKCRIEKGMKQAIEYAANELIPAVHASKEEKCTIFQTAFFVSQKAECRRSGELAPLLPDGYCLLCCRKTDC